MLPAGTQVLGNLAIPPLRVGVLPLGQVVFGPAQRRSVPSGVSSAGVGAGFGEGLHRGEGAGTDGVVQRGAVGVQVRARAVDVRSRLDQLTAWLARAAPDVLCMQETNVEDEIFPHDALAEVGYRAVAFGQRTYNGVAIAALALTLTPVVVAIDRDDNPDTMLTLLLAVAAWGLLESLRSDRYQLRWLMLSAVAFGLAFNTKMLEGFIPLPALAVVYLVAAKGTWRARIGRRLLLGRLRRHVLLGRSEGTPGRGVHGAIGWRATRLPPQSVPAARLPGDRRLIARRARPQPTGAQVSRRA